MHPFAFAVALAPAAIYVLLLGAINFSRRPHLLVGGREIAALALALSGFAVVGPMQLFYPHSAASTFGALTWVLMLTLYVLLVILWILAAPPRLVIYNFTAEQLRTLLTGWAERNQAETRWAGDCVSLSRPELELRIETSPMLRNVSLVAARRVQSEEDWRSLKSELRSALSQVETSRNPSSMFMLLPAAGVLAAITHATLSRPEVFAQGLLDLLRL